MNEERLKEIYAESEVAKAFLDHMAGRVRIQTATKVHRIAPLFDIQTITFCNLVTAKK